MAKKQRFHFIGIGGISMSGLALMIKSKGYEVSGSDVVVSDTIVNLEKNGISFFLGHSPDNVFNCDVVIYSHAISYDNPELRQAYKLGKLVLSRAQLLGKVSNEFKNVIAISGTHGKTTTTAMIGEIFLNAGLAPTVHIGGVSKNLNSSTIIGKDEFLITEACEYRDTFLSIHPTIGVVLNVESDHLDYFKNKKYVKKSFNKFLSQSFITATKLNPYTVILNKQKYRAKDIIVHDLRIEFTITSKDLSQNIVLNTTQKHNITNAIFAFAVAREYDIEPTLIAESLEKFSGVKRRYEKIGTFQNANVIIDYAHHPTEINNVIKNFPKRSANLFVVFQPHTYSRTKKLLKDFVIVLSKCENLIIYKTYPARERFDIDGDAKTLQKLLPYSVYLDNYISIKKYLRDHVWPEDTVLILGAGDINELADYLVNNQ